MGTQVQSTELRTKLILIPASVPLPTDENIQAS